MISHDYRSHLHNAGRGTAERAYLGLQGTDLQLMLRSLQEKILCFYRACPAYVSNFQLFKLLKNRLIHKSAIKIDYNGHIGVLENSNSLDHTPDHTLNTPAGVTVFFSSPEGTVRQKSFPCQLQCIESFAFFNGNVS